MTDNRKRGLRKAERIMRHVRSVMDPVIPVQYVQTFLAVALDEGKSLGEYADDIGTNLSTASRHMLDLGDRDRKGREGYKLVERRTHPTELRKNVYTLTPRGKLLATAIADIVDGD